MAAQGRAILAAVDLGIAGKTALVTAGSKGLGLASAMALAAEGVQLTICARGEDALRAAERQITDAGGVVLAIAADVTDPAVPEELIEATADRYGGLDILVANAGGPPPGRALEIDEAAINAALNANLLTSVRLVRAAVPYMRATSWGRICLITSSSIKQPIPTLSLSNMARTGLWAWAKTAASDLASEGITLNTACPGLHATDRVKELGHGGGRMGDPGDFGKTVAFLCSRPAAFINGTSVLVDGGAALGLL
ncbi:MAG: 3-oxoacyl-[acyl-carrier protein] reductase [Acidimicrobiaceae bacterium]|nr:3-oxoacyl-[acyl-carrier protein] reductase [Acidimicrobiaceae bacterium]